MNESYINDIGVCSGFITLTDCVLLSRERVTSFAACVASLPVSTRNVVEDGVAGAAGAHLVEDVQALYLYRRAM